MRYRVPIFIVLEAKTYKDAYARLAPFIENPRNPNLLPSDVGSLELSESSVSQHPKTIEEIDEDEDKEMWAIWRDQYGWASSKSLDGVLPFALYTRAAANGMLSFYEPEDQLNHSVRKYLPAAPLPATPIENQPVWHIWKEGYGWGWSDKCDGKKPSSSLLTTKNEAEEFLRRHTLDAEVKKLYSVRPYKAGNQ